MDKLRHNIVSASQMSNSNLVPIVQWPMATLVHKGGDGRGGEDKDEDEGEEVAAALIRASIGLVAAIWSVVAAVLGAAVIVW